MMERRLLPSFIIASIFLLSAEDAESGVAIASSYQSYSYCERSSSGESASCAVNSCGANCQVVVACEGGGWFAVADEGVGGATGGSCGFPDNRSAEIAALQVCGGDCSILTTGFVQGTSYGQRTGRFPSYGNGAVAEAEPDPVVRGIQEDLTALGYSPGPIDGILGPRTRSAIRLFESDYGLPVSGDPSEGISLAIQSALDEGAGPNTNGSAVMPENTTADISNSPHGDSQLRILYSGTGFLIDRIGNIITNSHVVESCEEIGVRFTTGHSTTGSVTHLDVENDLAVVLIDTLSIPMAYSPAVFRVGRGITPGEVITVTGFPLSGILSENMNISSGIVNTSSGILNDTRFIQISAPVQSGNSGGPLLDSSGRVVGVVVATLDSLLLASITGEIPQNVNFAINANIVKNFLESNNLEYQAVSESSEVSLTSIYESASNFTVQLNCLGD